MKHVLARTIAWLALCAFSGLFGACTLVQDAAWLDPQATQEQPGRTVIKHAQLSWEHGQAPVRVDLPHDWLLVNPKFQGTAVYWLQVPQSIIEAARAKDDMVGLFVRRASMNTNFYLGDSLISPSHSADARQWNMPLLIRVPTELLVANKGLVRVDVFGLFLFRGGMSQVVVGPVEQLERNYSWLEFLRVSGSQVDAVLAFLAAVYVLIFWWGAREHISFAWFGAACLVWSLRHTNFFWQDPPLGFEAYSQLVLWGNYLAYTLFLLFALSYTSFRRTWLQWLILAYGILPLPLMWLLGRSMVVVAPYYGLPGVALALAITGGIFWRYARTREREYLVVAIVVAIYLGFLIRDYRIVSDGQYDGVYFSHHVMALLSLVVSWLMVRRQIQSSAAIENLQEQLKQRLQDSQKAIEASHLRQRELEFSAMRSTTLAAERSRMMREMHDGVGSQLVAGLHALRSGNVSSEDASNIVDQILDDLRLAVDALEPSSKDLLAPLGNFRYRYMSRLRAAGIEVQWEVDQHSQGMQFAPESVFQVLRLVQEAFANTIKHAKASVIKFSVRRIDENRLRLIIEDNGLGFDAKEVDMGRGLGNMRQRAKEIGAPLTIESVPGCTRIAIEVRAG